MLTADVGVENIYQVECIGPDGVLKWKDEIVNLVVTEGRNDLLTKYFKGSTYTAAWYVGLTGSAPTANAADTLASNAGWDEVTPYSGNRPALSLGTASSGSIDNSASKASYSINTTATVGGAFVCSAASGTSGTLYGIGAFSGGDKSVGSGDTLNVTVTLTASAS